jgi:hypothetical protein
VTSQKEQNKNWTSMELRIFLKIIQTEGKVKKWRSEEVWYLWTTIMCRMPVILMEHHQVNHI